MAVTASSALMTMMMACPGGYCNIESHGYGADGGGYLVVYGDSKGNGAAMAALRSTKETMIMCHGGDSNVGVNGNDYVIPWGTRRHRL